MISSLVHNWYRNVSFAVLPGRDMNDIAVVLSLIYLSLVPKLRNRLDRAAMYQLLSTII
jgi:hypothetical protein